VSAQDAPVTRPFRASANGDQVVVLGDLSVAVAMTPEAALASLEPLRAACEEALRNRAEGRKPDIGDHAG
jgi:hypothetical protein